MSLRWPALCRHGSIHIMNALHCVAFHCCAVCALPWGDVWCRTALFCKRIFWRKNDATCMANSMMPECCLAWFGTFQNKKSHDDEKWYLYFCLCCMSTVAVHVCTHGCLVWYDVLLIPRSLSLKRRIQSDGHVRDSWSLTSQMSVWPSWLYSTVTLVPPMSTTDVWRGIT